MRTGIPYLLAIAGILNFTSIAKASDLPPAGTNEERIAMQAAIEARNEFVRALVNRDYADLARAGFDHSIHDLADQLRHEHNAKAAADELEKRWGNDHGVSQFEMALALNLDDLGDHAPLFQWLETYFTKLEDKYGSLITKLPIVQNVRMLNFALPVVFAPASKRWQLVSQDNRIEYRKHFIPFANLVTYYTSLYSCNAAVAKSQFPQLKKLCKTAATKLEFVMGRYLAPSISDFIYKTANRSTVRKPVFTRDQLRYENGDDLATDVRHALTLQ